MKTQNVHTFNISGVQHFLQQLMNYRNMDIRHLFSVENYI